MFGINVCLCVSECMCVVCGYMYVCVVYVWCMWYMCVCVVYVICVYVCIVCGYMYVCVVYVWCMWYMCVCIENDLWATHTIQISRHTCT